jgi:hypothetical protein
MVLKAPSRWRRRRPATGDRAQAQHRDRPVWITATPRDLAAQVVVGHDRGFVHLGPKPYWLSPSRDIRRPRAPGELTELPTGVETSLSVSPTSPPYAGAVWRPTWLMGALDNESTPLGSGLTVRVVLPDSEERHIRVRYEVDEAATPPGTLVDAAVAPVGEGPWDTFETAVWNLADADGRVSVQGFGLGGLRAPYHIPHVVNVYQPARRRGEEWVVDRVVRSDVYGADHQIPTRLSDRGVSFDWSPEPGDQLLIFHRLVRSVTPDRR